MIKNLLVGLVLVVLVVVGFWLFKSGKKNAEVIAENTINSTASSTNTSSSKNSPIKSSIKPASFTSLLPQKGNYECTYQEVSQTSRSSHVLYLSEGKMRGEFRTTTANGASSNIVVYDGNYLYNWIEGQTVGKISQPRSISDFPAIIPKDILSASVLGSGLNSVSWECHPWIKVSSLLAKPTYVRF